MLRLGAGTIQELAAELKAQLIERPEFTNTKPSLAVASFRLVPEAQLSATNANNVREDLSTALAKAKAFDIVERGQLDQVLKELRIGQSDTFDQATAQQLGRLIGARLVLVGSISDRGAKVVINSRIIDTETGVSAFAANVEERQ
jgi:TolB-like protein